MLVVFPLCQKEIAQRLSPGTINGGTSCNQY
ncbi:hypothetical protein EHW99_2069 [Erwinia amylovora]|uniref:Uncharacterized protein n=3 Tax=Erwinia amylovora TaxID=552 RepID=A0A830ZYB5_ERWAM|nr:hypothetical protein EaACW_1521 [Erwinia amylovora ACW56400]QJQ54771.1 hypothetical protein EHX00_2069 [Erwinia amylovora]CBA20463.1 hypothetical protein predicted by Glimmer/Critica [Erwinia amylovora CFBP1430]CBX80376.1 hypothetical protein predicted by Glimmer/Critica [Erwinia amylovora ATCC BAA-2158]CCO78367.1 hypothetical protein BN432_1564 [Erwinia amylovora Ea356]CCO82156.1 hypothetical protein BN433_1579 [Erwinia amylovora Ea266]CCO85952.1 hypothetical protein BN434_1559 [Erwinia a